MYIGSFSNIIVDYQNMYLTICHGFPTVYHGPWLGWFSLNISHSSQRENTILTVLKDLIEVNKKTHTLKKAHILSALLRSYPQFHKNQLFDCVDRQSRDSHLHSAVQRHNLSVNLLASQSPAGSIIMRRV